MRLVSFSATAALAATVACGTAFGPGEGSGGGASGGGSAGGASGSCQSVTDCGSPPSRCVALTCEQGQCVSAPRQAGPLASNEQVAGDCRKLRCDGNGNEGSKPELDDVPDDGNPCTEDLCDASGNPVNEPLPASTPCGNPGMSCDGNGTCQGCVENVDCGAATYCAEPLCKNGGCEMSYRTWGDALPQSEQTDGDCQELVCDGAGGEITIDDDADVPADDNPHDCQAPVACAFGNVLWEIVSNGKQCGPNGLQECCAGQCCAEGLVCMNGQCG